MFEGVTLNPLLSYFHEHSANLIPVKLATHSSTSVAIFLAPPESRLKTYSQTSVSSVMIQKSARAFHQQVPNRYSRFLPNYGAPFHHSQHLDTRVYLNPNSGLGTYHQHPDTRNLAYHRSLVFREMQR